MDTICLASLILTTPASHFSRVWLGRDLDQDLELVPCPPEPVLARDLGLDLVRHEEQDPGSGRHDLRDLGRDEVLDPELEPDLEPELKLASYPIQELGWVCRVGLFCHCIFYRISSKGHLLELLENIKYIDTRQDSFSLFHRIFRSHIFYCFPCEG